MALFLFTITQGVMGGDGLNHLSHTRIRAYVVDTEIPVTTHHHPSPPGHGWHHNGSPTNGHAMTDTSSVGFEVRSIEPVHGAGRLVALAVVAVDIDGVELVLQGVQVMREPDGGWRVRPPVWRHPGSGAWVPAVVLPDELRDAIGAEVLARISPDAIRLLA